MMVLDRLLNSDSAICWQVLRDLTNAPTDQIEAERARVAHEGWGAQLLAANHDELLVDLGEREGQPSRWITLRALRVLRWAGREG